MDIFRVRLNCVDHYQGMPTVYDPQLFRSQEQDCEQNHQYPVPRVPVIRVFGATATGQKVCAHIHGAFPYLYIEYGGSLESEDVDIYIRRLRLSIDHALAVSYRRNLDDGKSAFVAHITLVKGIPFYGYHVGYNYFLKIYLLNPLHMTRLTDLLRQGTVMKTALQPYESHIQYILQWMCDYNLYGCAYIDCSKVVFRGPVPEYLEMNNTTHHWHDRTIPKNLISDEAALPRQSHCSLEVDVCVQDIMNRCETKARLLHHDFVEKASPLVAEEKLVHSMAGLWRDEARRRKARMGMVDDGSSPFPPEVLASVSADPRSTQNNGWIHSDEYKRKMHEVLRDETDQSDGRDIGFHNFIQTSRFEQSIQTAFESTEDLFPANLAKLKAKEEARITSMENLSRIESGYIEVDERRILAIAHDEILYNSDEDVARELGLIQEQQEDNEPTDGHLVPHGAVAELDSVSTVEKLSTTTKVLAPDTGYVGPSSSSELETEGICDPGNYDYGPEDAFNIPREYTGDLSSAIIQHRRAKSSTLVLARPLKRQKIVHDEFPSELAKSARTTLETSTILSPLPAVTRSTKVPPNGVMVTSADVAEEATHQPASASSIGIMRFPANKMFAKRVNVHREYSKLPFCVVKDPQDPHAMQRLCQQAKGPGKSPPGSLGANGAFEPSEASIHALPVSLDPSPSVATEKVFPGPTSWVTIMASEVCKTFNISTSQRMSIFAGFPPSEVEVSSIMQILKNASIIYQDAFYSNEEDVPERPREYAGREFKLGSITASYLPNFDADKESVASLGEKLGVGIDQYVDEKRIRKLRRSCTIKTWEIGESPPTRFEVHRWIVAGKDSTSSQAENPEQGGQDAFSQVDGPTQNNKYGFKYSQKQSSTSVQHETQYMSIMSLEIHVNTRGSLVPDPEQDEISCIFWGLQSDGEGLDINSALKGTHVGVLALSESGELGRKISKQTSAEVEVEQTELDMINRMIELVRSYDPDILTGFEVHGGSWGYVIERARIKYDYDLCDEFSRVKSLSHGRFGKENDKWGFNQTSTIRITGRHVINVWRAMRGELNLLQYTMENIAFHLLHRRIPHYSFVNLTKWYNTGKSRDLSMVIDYFVSRVQLDLEILEQSELIPRTSEQARLLGVDFFSVFSRGSQFKVESLICRIAKPENLILVSPSRNQVGQQNALECLSLVMEPQSAFYTSPLLVLDFQSLYPSVMIAYNYCYSTFLGRVVNWRGQNKMGFTDYKREARLLELLKDHINIAPNGMMYVRPEIRKSLLAKMLGEILETRVMVKSGMKVDKDDKALQRLLNNRQLALKLIANVTYGYTSASFSGRMPCSEIADSIVQTGRETLEKAIALIHSVEKWGAEVVYGDTDSLFVYLKGRTKDEAFDIGNEIAKSITDMNPRPVKLKFEKVYFPCVLLAKKRYVGFKYESKAQQEPDFDAKGIETVRRDGTPAEQKIEENALKILFRTADLSQVKDYFQAQCAKIMKGKVSIQDFCFAKEVKLGTYSDKVPPPPGALISTRRMLEDPRAEPQYGERIPYVVVTGVPGARLIDRCVAPEVLLQSDHYEIDAEYYITKNLIPPLERIFNLVGANVRHWYDEMPKYQRIRRVEGVPHTEGNELPLLKKTLDSYMKSSACLVCQRKLEAELPICTDCMQLPEIALVKLQSDLNKAEAKAFQLEKGNEVLIDGMVSSIVFILIYLSGGLTFLPIVLGVIVLHGYLTFPLRQSELASPSISTDPIRRDNDDDNVIKSGPAAIAQQFQRGHEPDVAEGYFAVCREYVPGGVNGKPPERTTPAGEAIAEESPTVYQSMYRSLFDRKQAPTLENNRGNGRSTKKARNVFYVVLRHGHLMLYDDLEQVEVRHVISLAHHDVSIYSGGNEIPEGELWIKRNAIQLTRKENIADTGSSTKPFFLFSENCSDKEDFYFALLQNQDRQGGDPNSPPPPQHFEVKDIISLVQRLHSSEEHLQTRWVNAMVGRAFLAVYKTQDLEDIVCMKITKKIARVRKPAFLSGISLQKVDLGEGAPHITNPHLKDLTVDGDCCVEADFKYDGNFRLEIAATARIDLGTRFKAREVNLVLAVVVKKLEGHVLVRIKPPPSNRIWISFQSMPHIEMTIEPIVSSRQITYGIILRAIENRIREVIAETIVLPHWDDSPFFNTAHQRYRGGIWTDEHCQPLSMSRTTSISGKIADHDVQVESVSGSSSPESMPSNGKDDRLLSMPALVDNTISSVSQRMHKSSQSTESIGLASSTGAQQKSELPKAIRSRSFAAAAHPILSMDNANVESPSNETKIKGSKDATSIMTEISNRSQPISPYETPVEYSSSRPTSAYGTQKSGSCSQITSNTSMDLGLSASQATILDHSDLLDRAATTANDDLQDKIFPPEPGNDHQASGVSRARPLDLDKKKALPSIGAAAAVAKKWGWNAITRSTQQGSNSRYGDEAEREGIPAHPIGRGRPLPPPGQPLPRPDKRYATPIAIPKRKPLPPPLLPERRQMSTSAIQQSAPPLPQRFSGNYKSDQIGHVAGVLVVEAPLDSESASPLDDGYGDFIDNIKSDEDEEAEVEGGGGYSIRSATNDTITERGCQNRSPSPRARSSHHFDTNDDGETPNMTEPSWCVAQEEEARSKTIWMEHQERS
ncbi:DNA polymerase zeta [Xylographa opegraphella]|nr:DNA polymerase zeta [Xylographa opegraphella]